MKANKKILATVITGLVTAAILAGCGQTASQSSAVPSGNSSGKSATAAPADNSANETDTTVENDDVYSRFLDGDGTVSWASYVSSDDPDAVNYWDYNFKDFFDTESSYTYDEFVDKVLQAEKAGSGMTGDAADVQYAMVDLQGSGVPALALQIVMKDQGDTPEYQLFIIKDNGKDSLDIALTRAHGYRTDGYLDPLGFYYEYGRTAGLHGNSVETIDPEGSYRFLYGEEDNSGIYMLTQDENIMKEAEEAGIEMQILGRHLVTERSGFSDPDSGYWNYYRLDENENIVSDESIYEEGNIYKTIWDEIGHERVDDEALYQLAMQNCKDNGMDEQLIAENMVIRTPDTDSSADEVTWSNVR